MKALIRPLAAAALFAGPFAAPAPAEAACLIPLLCTCTATATGVNFGNYVSMAGGNTDAAGSVRVRCLLIIAGSGSFRVDLSTGQSGNFGNRQMRFGTSNLNYNLYTDPARSQIWGNGTGVTGSVTESFTLLRVVERNVPVYGRVPGGQNVPAGVYADTIIVTVTY